MMEEKNIAVMIYPHFSMQEISCLTAALSVWHGRKVDVFASSKQTMMTEDGFQVIASKTFDEFCPQDYCCLILPGILNPLPALFDDRNIAFLRKLAATDIVIAGISSAPMLLAKAGLLENVSYTAGIWEEIGRYLDFIPWENNRHQPLVHDKNIITAIGFAFREFAIETLRALHIPCEDDAFTAGKTDTQDELIYQMGDEGFAEFVAEYHEYLKCAPLT